MYDKLDNCLPRLVFFVACLLDSFQLYISYIRASIKIFIVELTNN